MSAENDRWRAAIAGLQRIIADPNETPTRRRKARNALSELTLTVPTFSSEFGNAHGEQRHTSGDVAMSMQTRAYEGFSA